MRNGGVVQEGITVDEQTATTHFMVVVLDVLAGVPHIDSITRDVRLVVLEGVAFEDDCRTLTIFL